MIAWAAHEQIIDGLDPMAEEDLEIYPKWPLDALETTAIYK